MSSGTINFTKEHEARLMELAGAALFNNWSISGSMGSKLNIYDLMHNTSLNTLKSLYKSLKNKIEDIEDTDQWSMTDYQQSKLREAKGQAELINLLIGYTRSESIRETNNQKVKALKAKALEIKESTMTPEQRLEALNKEIADLGGDTVEVDEEPAAEAPSS